MKRYMAVVVLAVIAFLFGLLFLAASTAPRISTTTFTLQPGAGYCTHKPFATALGGTLAITFTASPGLVEQYVMTEAQYTAYFSGGGLAFVGSDSGGNGTFTTSLPSGGSYEVLSCHAPGYESVLQTGRHTLTINAPDPGPFDAGVGAFVVGVLLLFIALWVQRRSARQPALPALSPYATAPGPGGAPPPSIQIPGPPSGPASGLYGTLLVSVENRAAAAETVQLLLNGAPAVTLSVPAGGTSQATLHPSLLSPFGNTVRVEAVTPDGRRGSQDVFVTSDKPAPVALRIG